MIAVLAAIAATAVFGLVAQGVGALAQGFPSPSFPSVDVSDLPLLAAAALGISLVAIGDTNSTPPRLDTPRAASVLLCCLAQVGYSPVCSFLRRCWRNAACLKTERRTSPLLVCHGASIIVEGAAGASGELPRTGEGMGLLHLQNLPFIYHFGGCLP